MSSDKGGLRGADDASESAEASIARVPHHPSCPARHEEAARCICGPLARVRAGARAAGTTFEEDFWAGAAEAVAGVCPACAQQVKPTPGGGEPKVFRADKFTVTEPPLMYDTVEEARAAAAERDGWLGE